MTGNAFFKRVATLYQDPRVEQFVAWIRSDDDESDDEEDEDEDD